MYNPPSLQGTINFPGYYGGGERGGAAIDPSSAMLYVNANNFPWESKLSPYVNTSPSSNLYKFIVRHVMVASWKDLAFLAMFRP